MDELELRRRSLAAPDDQDPEFREALKDNASAARYQKQCQQFDQRLSQALNDIAVPDGLQGRALLRLGLQRRQQRRRRFSALAMAASVLLSVGLWLWPSTPSAPDFPAVALAHVNAEAHHLRPATEVQSHVLRTLFEQVGARLDKPLPNVSFAFLCPTPLGRGIHLVQQSDRGPVTLLYLPEAEGSDQPQDFSDERFVGLSLPAPAGGAMAIIAESQAAIESLRQQLDQTLSWPGPEAIRLASAGL